MTQFRSHLAGLEADCDLLRVRRRLHWADEIPAVAAEAARTNGPALLFENVRGEVRLASGAYGGPDQMRPRSRLPWSRLAAAIGCDPGLPYDQLLGILSEPNPEADGPARAPLDTKPRDIDPHALGLPAVGPAPTVTLGLLAASTGDTTTWAPVRGALRGSDALVASVPASFLASVPDGARVTIALGVPGAALLAASLKWMGDAGFTDAIATANALDPLSVAETAGGLIPASSEVVLEGAISETSESNPERRAGWERATRTATAEIRVSEIATRDDPVIPFTPLGAPLADDLHLTGIVEAARLLRRVNNYWGVTPVEWISLPAETGLGMCLVASEILYAGFEWQLANTLFSFSRLFDKVLLLDVDTPPANLARAFDDMWVKANPSHDWEFGDPNAPPATTTRYRRDGRTGSRLYINATWNPHWDEEYIAPRVDFETSFPTDVRTFVLENWDEMGFSTPPRAE